MPTDPFAPRIPLFHLYRRAHQVMPLNGDILQIGYDVLLAPVTRQVRRDYPQATRQAMPGQRLLADDVGDLYLAYDADAVDEPAPEREEE